MIYENPAGIERRSLEIITNELRIRREHANREVLNPLEEAILKRVIHTTADFDFEENLIFTHKAAETGAALLRGGSVIITDTQMAMAGINKKSLEQYRGSVHCFIADEDVVLRAKEQGITRAVAAVDKAAEQRSKFKEGLIFAIGNAPTALFRIHELVQQGLLSPDLVIAVPVGFVNVLESKDLYMNINIPSIIARGRKGGSAVAATIINAMLYYDGNSPL